MMDGTDKNTPTCLITCRASDRVLLVLPTTSGVLPVSFTAAADAAAAGVVAAAADVAAAGNSGLSAAKRLDDFLAGLHV